MGAAASAALTDPVASTFEAIRTTLNDGAAFADMPREELISHALGLRDQLRAALAHYDSAKEYSAKEAASSGQYSTVLYSSSGRASSSGRSSAGGSDATALPPELRVFTPLSRMADIAPLHAAVKSAQDTAQLLSPSSPVVPTELSDAVVALHAALPIAIEARVSAPGSLAAFQRTLSSGVTFFSSVYSSVWGTIEQSEASGIRAFIDTVSQIRTTNMIEGQPVGKDAEARRDPLKLYEHAVARRVCRILHTSRSEVQPRQRLRQRDRHRWSHQGTHSHLRKGHAQA